MKKTAFTKAGTKTYPAWAGGYITEINKNSKGTSVIGITPRDIELRFNGCCMTVKEAQDVFGKQEVAEALAHLPINKSSVWKFE